ncbi:hypothetical protein B0H14DRAFT_2631673 [Mycena olivaceomarginata]|nr:hypothetical protein B0H14DRAFT_2631673 [Mycena olivaceomarginata]
MMITITGCCQSFRHVTELPPRHLGGAMADLALERDDAKYCASCKKWIGHGTRGGTKSNANWEKHIESKKHKDNIKAIQNVRPIGNFFSAKPRPPPPPPPPPPPSSDPGPSAPALPMTSSSIEMFFLLIWTPQSPHSPLTIPPATADDLISQFHVDPVGFVVSPTVPWEELIKKALNDFLNDGSRSKNTLELSQLIRRGNLGIDGFSIWLRRCLSELEISPRVVEGRVRQIIRAMMFLGATTDIAPLSPVVAPAVREASPVAPHRCLGQKLPLPDGLSPFLAYPLGIHADRQLPWGVEFGTAVILRATDCKAHAQQSGVCAQCAKILRHPIIKGLLDRFENTGPRPNTPYKLLTMSDAHTLLRRKNNKSTT